MYASSFMYFNKNEVDCLRELLPSIIQSCKENNISQIYGIDGGSIDGTLNEYKKNNIITYSQKEKEEVTHFN